MDEIEVSQVSVICPSFKLAGVPDHMLRYVINQVSSSYKLTGFKRTQSHAGTTVLANLHTSDVSLTVHHTMLVQC